MNKKIWTNNAFTIIELIVVIGIIGIIAGIATPKFTGFSKDANVATMKADIETLEGAIAIKDLEEKGLPKKSGKVEVDKALLDALGTNNASNLISLIDKNKLSDSIKTLSRDYSEYGVITKGSCKGKVLHLQGVENKAGNIVFSKRDSVIEELKDCKFDFKNNSYTKKVETDLSDKQSQVVKLKIDNLNNIKSVNTDTGNVEFEVIGDELILKLDDGRVKKENLSKEIVNVPSAEFTTDFISESVRLFKNGYEIDLKSIPSTHVKDGEKLLSSNLQREYIGSDFINKNMNFHSKSYKREYVYRKNDDGILKWRHPRFSGGASGVGLYYNDGTYGAGFRMPSYHMGIAKKETNSSYSEYPWLGMAEGQNDKFGDLITNYRSLDVEESIIKYDAGNGSKIIGEFNNLTDMPSYDDKLGIVGDFSSDVKRVIPTPKEGDTLDIINITNKEYVDFLIFKGGDRYAKWKYTGSYKKEVSEKENLYSYSVEIVYN